MMHDWGAVDLRIYLAKSNDFRPHLIQLSRIRETLNLSIDADSSTISRKYFQKKREKKIRGGGNFFGGGGIDPKCWIWQRMTFTSLFSTLIWNAELLPNVEYLRYFLDTFWNLKIMHVACQNISQIDITKMLCLFQAVIICLPMILNTDI